MIADACAEVGVRVGALLRGRPTATAPTGARPASPRTSASSARAARPLARARHGRRPRVVHALRRDARGVRAGRRDLGVGVHIHVAEDGADERDAEAARPRVVDRLDARRRARRRRCSRTACTSTTGEVALVHAAGATVAHNPRSNMNNAVGRARSRALGDRVVLGTDGIGADMLEESRPAFLPAARGRRDADAGWPLAPARAGRALAGRAFGEPLLGTLEPARRPTSSSSTTPRRRRWHAAASAGHWLFGLSLAARARRDGRRRGVVLDRRLDPRRPGRDRGRRAGAAERLWRAARASIAATRVRARRE